MTTTRELLHRHRQGMPLSWTEYLQICPHRATLCIEGPVFENTRPDGVVFIVGSGPNDFSEQMRADTVARLRDGDTVMLASNRQDLIAHAMDAIGLTLVPPAGNA